MRSFPLALLLGCCVAAWAQSSSSSGTTPATFPSANSQAPAAPAAASKPVQAMPPPNQAPPRSDSVDASALSDEPGESSSKDTQIDLSPPAGDDRAHPRSSDALTDAGGGDIDELHSWDPHKAAKDVEVGDFYFRRKNYRAAEDRYREALLYKDNDATATFRLAECLEKMNRTAEAREEYESYLRILPHGPEAEKAQKAIERLKEPSAETKPAK